ncbi:hypothetical protein H7I53_15585 [Mycolicibacterium pulveris]|uniref:Uncharacterized protein n=1 Tax=Mycolicibacterium pulveris TaxID=36813 RepID=A0A7I7UFH6_MYCPV|nr:hypothetical protein [Mycolicibacterium pulveris]MCV6981636.1 hypothetical protein [Mycolicibacterium pulveris]BBY80208.1 hypothetical protein MPUL_13660 [Mycolicibacterium pulveris]
MTETRYAVSTARPTVPADRPTVPVKWWAALGATVLAVQVAVVVRWMTGPYFHRVDPGPRFGLRRNGQPTASPAGHATAGAGSRPQLWWKPMSDKRIQLWCVYSVFGFIAIFLVGWVALAGFVPPPSPLDGAERIAELYEHRLLGVRVGLVLCIFASALLLPWGGAICAQMLRIEGSRAPLVWAWIAAQGCVVIEFVYPCTFWLVAAFRTEDSSRVLTFNDLGWLPFLGVVCTGMFQMVALAVLTLRDRRPDPVFPRWFAYFQLWCAVGVGCTFGVYIFKSGPLAFNGVLGFWVPVCVYFIWVVTTTLVTARAINNDDGADTHVALAERITVVENLLAKQLPTGVESASTASQHSPVSTGAMRTDGIRA